MSKQSITFEQSMQRLEEIVRLMERGDTPLEESLKLFEEGTALVAKCTKMLDRAELKLAKVGKGEDGKPVVTEAANENDL